jgi:hypothetical protein
VLTAVALRQVPSDPMAATDLVALAVMNAKFAATAAALNGVPSWKVTPLRRLKV